MIYRIVLIIVMIGCLIRGAFVFDMGLSAAGTNTTASAICLIAAVIAAGMLYLIDKHDCSKKEESHNNPDADHGE